MNTSGLAATTASSADAGQRRKSGTSTSIVVPGLFRRTARIVCAICSAPPSSRSSRSTLVITTWFSPSFSTATATRPGSNTSSASGRPVATLQKVHPRVHTSPMIIMVAWPWLQHSPTFGQAASSQTVTSRFSRMISRVLR